MLALLDTALEVVSAVWDVTEEILDLRRWRDDWDRTLSPVSLMLAASCVVSLAFLLWLYGAAAWAAIRALRP